MPKAMLAALFLLLSFGAGFGQQAVTGAGARQAVPVPAKGVDMAAPLQDMADTNAHQACMRHKDQGGGFSGKWAACTAYEAAWSAKDAAMSEATASAMTSITDAQDAAALVRLQSPP